MNIMGSRPKKENLDVSKLDPKGQKMVYAVLNKHSSTLLVAIVETYSRALFVFLFFLAAEFARATARAKEFACAILLVQRIVACTILHVQQTYCTCNGKI